MKPTLLDEIIGLFSPQAKVRRLQARIAEQMLRGYDAAKFYPTSDWTSVSKSDPNEEIKRALSILREKSRDLSRNSPFALKATNVIVNNVVGAGIEANIRAPRKKQLKRLRELWKQVTETSLCDASGRNNFFAQQSLAMRAIVESGEALALKEITLDAPRLKLLESDHIASDIDDDKTVQGIELDKDGKPVAYNLYVNHPGSKHSRAETVRVDADKVIHVFRQERPGQARGVPWGHACIEALKDLADFSYATLVGKKVAACLVGTITTNGDSTFSPNLLKERREKELQMTPGTFRYLNPGEDVKFNNPPSATGYSEYERSKLREVASGYCITYEALTGDYSQVNFSSGRMGHIEFRRNIDAWRWNILIPGFCEPYFQLFLEWARLRGEDVKDVSVEWIPPAHVMIDPTKEIFAEKEAVLAGFKSRSRVIREMGDDPDLVREEIRQEREADAAAGLKFDTDISNNKPTNNNKKEQVSEEDQKDASDSTTSSESE